MKKILLAGTMLAALGASAFAADKVVVGYGTGATQLPFFVALEQGLFEKHDIEIEGAVIPVNSNL